MKTLSVLVIIASVIVAIILGIKSNYIACLGWSLLAIRSIDLYIKENKWPNW